MNPAILIGARSKSAFRIPQSAFAGTGDPEFKAVEKEIKVHWLT